MPTRKPFECVPISTRDLSFVCVNNQKEGGNNSDGQNGYKPNLCISQKEGFVHILQYEQGGGNEGIHTEFFALGGGIFNLYDKENCSNQNQQVAIQ